MSRELRLKYSHPFTLADLQEQDVNLISEEISRLQKSIALLKQTNETIRVSVNLDHVCTLSSSSAGATSASSGRSEAQAIEGMSDISPEERQEYMTIISENEEVIDKQQERVTMCKFALARKMGFDPGNRHYDLDADTTAIRERPSPTIQSLHGSDRQANAQMDTASSVHRPPAASLQDDSENGIYL